MEGRNIFALDGITGMLIATLLLIGILVFLTVGAISSQQASADNFYEVKDPTSIKMFQDNQQSFIVDANTK